MSSEESEEAVETDESDSSGLSVPAGYKRGIEKRGT